MEERAGQEPEVGGLTTRGRSTRSEETSEQCDFPYVKEEVMYEVNKVPPVDEYVPENEFVSMQVTFVTF